MRNFRTACLLLGCLSVPLVSAGQSLGNVAKKERERRDKNKKEGVAAREFSEEEVFGEQEEEKAREGAAGEETESSDEPSNEDDKAAVIPGVSQKLDDDSARYEKESQERRRGEAEWRSKASNARARIADARKAVQFFEGLALPPNGRYVDVNGNTVIESVDHLQRLTREAKEELAAAELDWKQIEDEARRAGIPPGWLR
ncbi:MAG: hypothetical protein ACRD1Z_02495 [Vicinamibacteria bacterium]